jgi:type I restriction enzyme, S subunit
VSFPSYPAYKDSGVEWLGKVPEHWEEKRIRFLLRDGNEGMKIGPFGSALTSEMLSDDGAYKVYGQENIIAQDFSVGTRRINHSKFNELSVYQVQPGDVLVTMMGTSGRCEVVPVRIEPGIMDSHLLRMRLAEHRHCVFVRWLIDEAEYVRIQVRLAGKGTIMHGLNSSIVKDLLLAIPPLYEQELILGFLDHETTKIDALIAEQQRLIGLLQEKRQAVISHAVTKGLNPDAPMKDSGVEWLGEVPGHWEVRPLKSEVFFQEGPGIMASDFMDEGIPLLRVSCVQGDLVTLDGCNYLDPSKVASKWSHFAVDEEDLLLSGSASLGVISEVGDDAKGAIPYTGLIRLRPLSERIAKNFVKLLIESSLFSTQIDLLKAGATIQHFGPTHLRQMKITMPPEQEQILITRAIAEAKKRFDGLIGAAEQAVELLQERRSALISAAVTGQIDVRGLVPEAAAA